MENLSRAERRRRARSMAGVLSQLPPPATARWWHSFLRWRWFYSVAAGVGLGMLLRHWGIGP